MIINFSVTNFSSIKNKIDLNFEKTTVKGNNSFAYAKLANSKILKSNVIYGPNGSGKSNIITALKALQFLVDNSAEFQSKKGIAPYESFRLDPDTENAPIELNLIFVAENVKYDFLVVYDRREILYESLHYYPVNVKSLLFERIKSEPIKFGVRYKGAKRTIEKLLNPNQLFFSKAAQNNVESVKIPFDFISSDILLLNDISHESNNSLHRQLADILLDQDNQPVIDTFNSLISALDTGIVRINIVETDWENARMPEIPEEIFEQFKEKYQYDVKTVHNQYKDGKYVGEINFSLLEESTGTRNLYGLAGVILSALKNGLVLVVDELEKNLHPAVTTYLIRLFANPMTNPRNAQLIFATHDVTQLTNENFRRDQIYFTEKNEYGVTNLVRCSDINGIRLDTPLDKWYNSGKIGGTPIIEDVEFLINIQKIFDADK